jgi:nucleoside-diphosphate-sugar epimerase
MAITNVALIGASGTLGPSVLAALKAHPTFTPYVLNRQISKSIYPKTRVITVPDDLDVDAVATLLKENAIDALVMTIAGSYVEQQKQLIDACFRADVKRVIPAEFGSCDSADEKTNELLPLMAGKKQVREYLMETCARERPGTSGKMTWTSLVTGHFFDWGLGCGLLKFDVRARKAYVQDGGDVKFSASNLDFIAKAVVRVLERKEETRDKLLYVHSHYVTQNEVLAALEKATGKRFEVVGQSSKEGLEVAGRKMMGGDKEATEEVVSVQGIVASDWMGKEGFANGVLGLEEEDLDEVVQRVVRDIK